MQELLVDMLGESGATVARYVIAIAVIVLLLVALRWALQRYRGGSGMGHRSRQPRLAVMDVAPVDARRRLVLIRRDNVEHLILIGGPTDIVVEQTIIKGVPVGTLGGRVPQRAGAPAAGPVTAPQSAAPAPDVAAAERDPALPPMGIVGAAAGLAGAGLAAATPEPTVVSVRPAPASARSAGPSPAPAPPPSATFRANEPRVEPELKPVRPGPYVPPEPTRPAPHPEAIAPIVSGEGVTKSASAPSSPVAAPPDTNVTAERRMAPVEADADYDDLARRLDEALRVDLAQSRADAADRSDPVRGETTASPAAYTRPIRGPAARNADAEEVVADLPEAAAAAPENVVELPPRTMQRPVPPPARSAGAWFRPRTPKTAEEPAPPAPKPAEAAEAPSGEPTVDEPGSAAPRDIEITLQSEPLIDTGPHEIPKAGSRLVPDIQAPVHGNRTPEERSSTADRPEPKLSGRETGLGARSPALPLRGPAARETARTGTTSPEPASSEAPPVSALKPPMTAIETVEEPANTAASKPREQAAAEPGPAEAEPAGPRVEIAVFGHTDDDAIDADTMPAASAVDTSAAAATPVAPQIDVTGRPEADGSSAAPAVPPPSDRREPDFSSLEDEMARLLDELAGDVRKDRR